MDPTAKCVMVSWVVVTAFWVLSAFRVKRTKQSQPVRGRFLYLGVIALVGLLLIVGIRKPYLNRVVLPHTLATGIVADFTVLLGVWVAIQARLALGGNWSSRVTLKEDHELIQNGPYRLIRHPIYSGLLLMVFGTAILGGQISGFVAALTCFGVFWLKARQEERLLSKNLPGYAEYMARTKALVPFLL